MKKILISLALALIIGALPTMAILDIDVECNGRGWWNTDYCQDWELDDEFNQVENSVNSNSGTINELSEIIILSTPSWLHDEIGGGGWSGTRVKDYLFNSFMDVLYSVFVPRTMYLELQDRVDALVILNPNGVVEVDLKAAQVKAWRTNSVIYYNDYVCYPNGIECEVQ